MPSLRPNDHSEYHLAIRCSLVMTSCAWYRQVIVNIDIYYGHDYFLIIFIWSSIDTHKPRRVLYICLREKHAAAAEEQDAFTPHYFLAPYYPLLLSCFPSQKCRSHTAFTALPRFGAPTSMRRIHRSIFPGVISANSISVATCRLSRPLWLARPPRRAIDFRWLIVSSLHCQRRMKLFSSTKEHAAVMYIFSFSDIRLYSRWHKQRLPLFLIFTL